VTAAAALTAVAAGVTAGPAFAATGHLAAAGTAGTVVAARAASPLALGRAAGLGSPLGHASSPGLGSPLGLGAASVPAPFGPTAAQAPHAVPAQAPRDPVVRISLATASGKHASKSSQQIAPADHAAAQRPAAAPHRRHRIRHVKPYLIFDSVTPTAIPPHHMVATYATGGYAVPASQVAGRGPVLWIDTRGTDPAAAALDVEPGDATPAMAASWAWHKLSATPRAVAHIYTMISEWPAVKAAIAALPHRMRSHVRYWIADPTGIPHVLPGASATQWYWGKNYDISTANPGFGKP
jgi:hypothetical protein